MRNCVEVKKRLITYVFLAGASLTSDETKKYKKKGVSLTPTLNRLTFPFNGFTSLNSLDGNAINAFTLFGCSWHLDHPLIKFFIN